MRPVQLGHQMWPLVRAGDRLVIEPGAGGAERGAVVLLRGGGATRVVVRRGDRLWVRGDAAAYLELVAADDVLGRVTAAVRGGRLHAVPVDRLAAAVGLVGGAAYTLLLHAANLVHLPLALALGAVRLLDRAAAPSVTGARDVVWGWSMVPVLGDGELLGSVPLAREARVGDVLLVQHATRAVCHRVVARLPGWRGGGPILLEKGDAHLRLGWFRARAIVGRVASVERLDGEPRAAALHGAPARAAALVSLLLGLAWTPVAAAANLVASLPVWSIALARRRRQPAVRAEIA